MNVAVFGYQDFATIGNAQGAERNITMKTVTRPKTAFDNYLIKCHGCGVDLEFSVKPELAFRCPDCGALIDPNIPDAAHSA